MKTCVPQEPGTDPLADVPLKALTRGVGYVVVSYLRVQGASTALASVDRRLTGARRALAAARDPSNAGALAASEARDAEAAVLRAHHAWVRFVSECGAAQASLARLVRRVAAGGTAPRRGASAQRSRAGVLERAAGHVVPPSLE